MEAAPSCPYCGATLPAGKKACNYCGSDILSSQPAELKPAPGQAMELPPEFSRLKRPKPVKFSLAGIPYILFGIPWTIFSLVFLVSFMGSSIRELMQFIQLNTEGITVQGIVTNLELDNSDDSTSYYVDYRFTALFKGEEQAFEQYTSVSEKVYHVLETGGRVEIIYAASDPKISTIKAQFRPPELAVPLLGGGMAIFFIVIGFGMIISGFRSAKGSLQLRLHGTYTQAIIFDRWVDTGSDGDSYYVAYAFYARTSQYEKRIISNAEESVQAYRKLSIGEKTRVRYVPGNPRVCQLADRNAGYKIPPGR